MIDGATILGLLAVGFLGGLLGGLLGVGGSVLFIPVLTVFLEQDYHTAQAAALVVNVCVGFAAAQGHIRSGLVSWRLQGILIPCAIAASVVGVCVSNQFAGAYEVYLRRIFGVTLVYVILANLYRMLRRQWPLVRRLWKARKRRRGPFAIGAVGGLMGFMAGLLGIGGGVVAVPGQQILLGMRLRTAVANSSVAIVFACVLAAAVKHSTLPQGVDPVRPWVYVGLLAPTAVIGAPLGALLTHRLPREWVRLVFMAFLAWASVRMLTS